MKLEGAVEGQEALQRDLDRYDHLAFGLVKFHDMIFHDAGFCTETE